MKKTLIVALIVISVMALGTAAWFFIIGGDVVGHVDSIGSYKEAIISFGDLNLNTTEGSDNAMSSMSFVYNREGNFSVEIVETVSDLSNGTCSNAAKDCSVEVIFADGQNPVYKIRDGDNITIPDNSNLKYINASLDCVAYSCPQDRDIRIRLNQVA